MSATTLAVGTRKTQKEDPCPGKKTKCPSQGDTGLDAFAMGCGIQGMGFACGSGEHTEAQEMHWCSGGRIKTQLQSYSQGGLRNRRNLPWLCLEANTLPAASSSLFAVAVPAPAPAVPLVRGLVRLQPCPCKPQGSRATRQQCQLPVQDVPDMPFPRLCHLELPINSEQGTAWPGSRSTAQQGFQLCCFQRGFSPNSSMDALPTAPRGMHCHPIDRNTTLAAAGGPGMQENHCHLASTSGLYSVPCWGYQGWAQALFADSRHSLQAVLPPHFLG